MEAPVASSGVKDDQNLEFREVVKHLINRDAMTFYERVIRKFGWLGS